MKNSGQRQEILYRVHEWIDENLDELLIKEGIKNKFEPKVKSSLIMLASEHGTAIGSTNMVELQRYDMLARMMSYAENWVNDRRKNMFHKHFVRIKRHQNPMREFEKREADLEEHTESLWRYF